MSIKSIVIILGLLIAILPQLGFPNEIDTLLYRVFGIGVALFTLLFLRSRRIPKLGHQDSPKQYESNKSFETEKIIDESRDLNKLEKSLKPEEVAKTSHVKPNITLRNRPTKLQRNRAGRLGRN